MKKMKPKKISNTLLEILTVKTALLIMLLGFGMTEIHANFDTKISVLTISSDNLIITGNDDANSLNELDRTIGDSQFNRAYDVESKTGFDETYYRDITGLLNGSNDFGLTHFSTNAFDCLELNANIGDACDDGNVMTENDVISADCECIGTPTAENVCGLETFENAELTASYADGSFVGNNDIIWSYIQSRNEAGDANNSGIQGNAIMLRRLSDNSSISSSIISDGITNFSVKLYKGFTGGGDRQVELFINDVSYGTSDPFNDFDMHLFEVQDINITGDFVIEIKNITDKQVILDNISWTCESYDCIDLQANIGNACDDGDDTTGNDTINENCECVGIPLEQFDCPELEANFGDPCDDENDSTENDIINVDCECAGTIVYDCTELEANIGDACDDGDDSTENDVIGSNCLCAGTPVLEGDICGFENFNNAELPTSYANGDFVGNDGITWSYIAARDENGDLNNSGIDGNAILLRRVADNSSIYSSAISGGLGDFSVKLYKGFTGGGDRQVELFINEISYGTSNPFDDYDMHVFEVQNINISGDFVIEIRNVTSRQIILDDINWTCGSYDCPELEANVGDACDDNDSSTGNDTINENCECVGIPLEQFDCPELEANFGDPCDDENNSTENDTINVDCECVGTIVYDCTELEANIGDACDDGDDSTENDVIGSNCLCAGTPVLEGDICGLENFDNAELSGPSYANGSFLGNNGITWTYIKSRDENGDANNSGIDGNAIMLQKVSENSSIYSSAIAGGLSDFSVKLYKGFSGGGDRQVELFINEISYGTSDPFDDYDMHIFEVQNINISGDFVLEIRNTTSKQIILDDITWTCGSYDCPELEANIGDACDDNDSTTGNDTINENCECVGIPLEQFDCPELEANFGDPCDDGNDLTENDIVNELCECVGTIVYDCPNLEANIGDACDDGDDLTEDDVVGSNCVCAGIPVLVGDLCGFENFDNAELPTSYADGDFVGNDGITWSYIAARDENGDLNNSGIDGNAILLRRIADNSSITSSTISGGISDFSVRLYKGFTGGGDRQVELFINEISYGISDPFDDYDMHIFEVQNINISGDFVLEIRNTTSKQIILDDITWTCGSYDCPELEANIGDACDDNDSTTGNDIINGDCECVGIPLEQFDCPELEANFGDPCDDGNDLTENDIVNELCECVGTLVYDCTDLEANIGDACDDGDDSTENDIIGSNCSCAGTPILEGDICGFENFDNLDLSGPSYANGSFVGNNGVVWSYIQARDENNDANNSGIDGNAIMLKNSADNASLISSSISGGIKNFSVKLYKGFTGGGSRKVELFINGISFGVSDSFDDYDAHIFEVTDINIYGDFTIEIKNATSKQIILDDITWTCGSFDCPELEVNIGDACDDGNALTENDMYNSNCDCVGTSIASTLNGSVDWNSNCGERDATVTFYEPSTATVVASYAVSIQGDGSFIISDLEIGTFDVIVNVNGYLAKGTQDVEIAIGDNNLDVGAILFGDFNNDDTVDIFDFTTLVGAFLSTAADLEYNPIVDADCDDIINVFDFTTFIESFLAVGDTAPLTSSGDE